MNAKAVSEAWSWRHAVTRSGLPATTRHVLLTLSVFMDEAGRSCFPSIEDLIERTGLGKTTVIKHLADAVEVGWLKRGEHGYRGRAWRRSEYEPCWPGRAIAIETDGDEEGGSGDEPPQKEEAVQEPDQGGSGGEPKVVREVNRVIDQSIDHSKDQSTRLEREGARAGADPSRASDASPSRTVEKNAEPEPRPWERDSDFMEAMRSWWTVDGIANAWRERVKMEPEAFAEAKRKIPVYLAMHQTRSERCAFSTYLGQRPFRLLPEPAADGEAPPARTELPAMSRAWCFVFFRLAAAATPSAIRLAREMLADAEFAKNAYVPIAAMPTDSDIAGLVKIERGGVAFSAWRRWLSSRASPVWLKPEAFGEWLWVPAEWPPGFEPETAEGELAEAAETA